jgi:UDP:flavonoid glycosyltransferase YjiC (YdhE family)
MIMPVISIKLMRPSSGVAQVVLPPWLDCYDFANRAELLGIGRWGSRHGAPRWIESELAPILVDVVLDKNAEYTAKARHLAEICRKDGGGRAEAARRILAFLKE